MRRFPDEEAYLRINSECGDRDVILLCTLDHPDPKILPLLFLAEAAKQLGARRVGLVAPYLAYMRQDKRFHPREALTSKSFAQLVSKYVDWLVTVDPHLHRYTSLADIYSIPTTVAHSAPAISEWIASNVERPLVVGPDEESRQWVTDVAARAGAPHIVLVKLRSGDRDVEAMLPETMRSRQTVTAEQIEFHA